MAPGSQPTRVSSVCTAMTTSSGLSPGGGGGGGAGTAASAGAGGAAGAGGGAVSALAGGVLPREAPQVLPGGVWCGSRLRRVLSLGDDLARGRAGACVGRGLPGRVGGRRARLQLDIARQIVVRGDGREAEGDDCVLAKIVVHRDMGVSSGSALLSGEVRDQKSLIRNW